MTSVVSEATIQYVASREDVIMCELDRRFRDLDARAQERYEKLRETWKEENRALGDSFDELKEDLQGFKVETRKGFAEVKEDLAGFKVETRKGFAEQDKVLGEHGRILAGHTKTLAEQGKKLAEHDGRFDRVEWMLEELLRRVPAGPAGGESSAELR